MTKLLDQTGDINGQQLYRLTKLYPLPPFVKEASSKDVYGNDELETHQFADPAHRQFPCHTAAATYISTLFFMNKKAEMDEDMSQIVEDRLDQFAFIYGMDERLRKLRQKLASDMAPKEEVDDESFALILDVPGSTTKERHYPLRNAIEVKK